MDELSAEARRLIEGAMLDDEPGADEAEASWGMVVSRVEAAEPGAETTARPRRPSSPLWLRVVVVLAVMSALSGLLLLRNREHRPTDRTMVEWPRSVATEPSRASADAIATDASRQAAEMLIEAEAALSRGDPQQALDLLERHAQLAPVGADLPHRLALRIRTLCAMDRAAEARNEATAFLQHHGRSPWAATVHGSCASR